MSIFEKTDYSKIKDKLLDHTINKINMYLNDDFFICEKKYPDDLHYSLKWLINKFLVLILKESDYDFYYKEVLKKDKIEYLELYFNSIIFFESYLGPFLKMNINKFEDVNIIQNLILKIIKNNNIDLMENKIEYKNKFIIFYKFINKDIKRLINNLNNYDWRDQMTKFFNEKKIVEREKILGWFSGHIESKIKDEINNNFFNKQRVHNLFDNLNNLYKHFDKTNNTHQDQIERFNKYKKLSDQSKFKKTEEDARLILYILIEHENKVNF